MAFNWTTTFRSGQWLAFRSFALNERSSVEQRLNTIDAQLRRIGEVTVFYETVEDINGDTYATERRKGFSVTAGSSLERLIQAYVVQGGNPLDISLFLVPDRMKVLRVEGSRDVRYSSQPSFGVIYPKSSEFYTGPIYVGGFASILKYPPARLGGRKDPGDANSYITSRVLHAKKWIEKEIKYKKVQLEERIKKLCDLREQLIQERDEILPQAVGGTIHALPIRFEENFSNAMSLSKIVAAIDSLFFVENIETPGEFDFTQINLDELTNHPTIFQDDETGLEANTAL